MWWDVYRARGVFAGEKCVAGGAKNVFRGKRIVCARSGASWPRVCVCVSPPHLPERKGVGGGERREGAGREEGPTSGLHTSLRATVSAGEHRSGFPDFGFWKRARRDKKRGR